VGDTAEFAAGLLDPDQPVPQMVKGRIERRYAVYRNNVTIGLMRALEANFPVTRKLLGEHYFAGFARDFAQSHPPASPLMFMYGQDLPQALDQAEDLASYPYLGDIARLEILWRESYHAADARPLTADAIAAIDPDKLFDCRLKAHPAMRLTTSRYAIHAIFVANTSEHEEDVLEPSQPQSILVTRPLFDVMFNLLTADQFAFFLALQDGCTFGDALDRAAAINTTFDLPGTLALLLQSGAFQSIQQGETKIS
jgi:Putative DNA-binding domain